MVIGRPEKPINWDLVEELLLADCTGTEIAANFDIYPDTLYRRIESKYGMSFTAFAAERKEKGDSNLRQTQYKKALSGDNTMLIWLGKLRLKQKDPDRQTDSNTASQVIIKVQHDGLGSGLNISAEALPDSCNQGPK